MPEDRDRVLSTEEGAVLAVITERSSCSLDELKQHVDQRYGNLLSLDVQQIRAILRRLEARGLIIARLES